MGSTCKEKLNSGYIIRPLSFFKDALSHTAEKVRAYLYSFGSSVDGVSIGYTKLSEKLNVSRTSIYRATSNERMRQAFNIEREGGKVKHYTYTKETPKEFSVRTELFFYTEEFVIFGNVRCLTDSEVNVLSLIYTWTRYEKAYKFTGNYADMARMLHIDYFTVLRAVSALRSAGLIRRIINIKENNKDNKIKRHYAANMDKIYAIRRRNEKKKKIEEKEKAFVSRTEAKRIKDLDERAERERFYAQRKERAELAQAKALKRANQNPRFRELAAQLATMEYKLAKAEMCAPITLPSLHAEKAALLAERKQVLESIGMTEEMLEVHYACEKCSDTGFLPSGKPCGCHKRLKGGG